MPKYQYKTQPLKHQREGLIRACNLVGFGYLWAPGLGKTKPQLDNFSWLYEQGTVDTLLVVAPNSVQRNWVTDEIPTHMPDRHVATCRMLIWKSTKLKTKKYKLQVEQLLKHNGPVVVAVNYESTITKKFKQFAARLMRRKVFMVLDESHRIKSTGSHVKKALVAIGKYAQFRRILTGTPLEQPEDIYTQIRFLDDTFWARKGFKTPTEFRNHFCVFRKGTRNLMGPRGPRVIEFQTPVGAKNLPELQGYVAEICHRLTEETAGVELPLLRFSKRYCQLSAEQARVYGELKAKHKKDGSAGHQTILQSGDLLKAELPITRLLRLQQIAAGYVSCEAEQPTQLIEPGINRRLDMCVEEILRELPHQAIIWSRFKEDINQLCRALGNTCVRYDGSVKEEDRARNKLMFQNGDRQFFVGNIKAGGTGLTLIQAKTMVFYENYFDLIPRQQADKRFHRIGQDVPVHIIDIICEDTVDEYIVDKLRAKFDIARQVTGDAEKEWL